MSSLTLTAEPSVSGRTLRTRISQPCTCQVLLPVWTLKCRLTLDCVLQVAGFQERMSMCRGTPPSFCMWLMSRMLTPICLAPILERAAQYLRCSQIEAVAAVVNRHRRNRMLASLARLIRRKSTRLRLHPYLTVQPDV